MELGVLRAQHASELRPVAMEGYYPLYFLSAFLFVLGVYVWLHHRLSLAQRVSGTGLLACSVFLATNADIVVSLFYMTSELGRFHRNNVVFETHLQEQGQKLHQLRVTARAFDEIEVRYGGNVENAAKELSHTRAQARANAAANVAKLCRIYIHKKWISIGFELDQAFHLMESALGSLVHDFGERQMMLLVGLKDSLYFLQHRGLESDTFAELVGGALSMAHVDRIPAHVKDVLDKDILTAAE